MAPDQQLVRLIGPRPELPLRDVLQPTVEVSGERLLSHRHRDPLVHCPLEFCELLVHLGTSAAVDALASTSAGGCRDEKRRLPPAVLALVDRPLMVGAPRGGSHQATSSGPMSMSTKSSTAFTGMRRSP